MPLGGGLIFYVSSILLMPTVKYLAISMLFFLTYFLLVGQKGGMVFISDFKKMDYVYFMSHHLSRRFRPGVQTLNLK